MIQLYSHPHSLYCRKVRVVLEEKKIPYKEIHVDLESGENKQDTFITLNPFGKVPVLDDEGFILYESGAINEYLEENHPTPPLLPKESNNRAEIRLMERAHDNYLSPHLGILFKQYFFTKPGLRDEKGVAESFKQIQKILAWVDKRLEGKTYFGGDLFSLADAAFVHTLLNLLPQFNVDMNAHRNIMNWVQRVQNRPSVQKTNPGLFRIPNGKKELKKTGTL